MHPGWTRRDYWINFGTFFGTGLAAAALCYQLASFKPFVYIWLPSYIAIGFTLSRFCTPSPIERIKERPSKSLESIYKEHYRDLDTAEEEFFEVWTKIADNLEVDPTKLRPTDRFDFELSTRGPRRGLDDEIIQLGEWAFAEFQRRGRSKPTSPVQSVDELVKLLLSGARRDNG